MSKNISNFYPYSLCCDVSTVPTIPPCLVVLCSSRPRRRRLPTVRTAPFCYTAPRRESRQRPKPTALSSTLLSRSMVQREGFNQRLSRISHGAVSPKPCRVERAGVQKSVVTFEQKQCRRRCSGTFGLTVAAATVFDPRRGAPTIDVGHRCTHTIDAPASLWYDRAPKRRTQRPRFQRRGGSVKAGSSSPAVFTSGDLHQPA